LVLLTLAGDEALGLSLSSAHADVDQLLVPSDRVQAAAALRKNRPSRVRPDRTPDRSGSS
jgi:hypothetical protein